MCKSLSILLKLNGVIKMTIFLIWDHKLCSNLCIIFQSRGVLYEHDVSNYVLCLRAYLEHICCDPKDGELYLIRLKSGETLMEDRSSSDVQIDCQNWV
jgi:hypothetical protein